MSRRAGSDLWMAAALTFAAAAIRFPTLAVQSFWLDEGYTVRLVRMSLGSMLHTIPRTESTPPVYYAVAWVWVRVFGSSEFGLRSLSALCGVALVPVTFVLARRLAGRRAAVIAGGLVVVSPLLIWFSQEARAYALATLLATASVLCLLGWRRDGGGRWAAGWALTAGLAIATHYFAVFVVAGELVVLWRRPDRAGPRALATAAVLAVGAALVPLALAQRGTGHADYIAQGSLATRAAQVPKQLLLGYASPHQLLSSVIAGLLVCAGALWPLLADRPARRRALLALGIGLAAVGVPIALALVGIDFLDTRNVLPALPALYVAAAIGFAAGPAGHIRLGAAAAGALALVCLVVVVAVETDTRYQRDDWRGASRALGRLSGPRAIVVSPGSGLIPLQAYLPGLRTLAGAARVSELDVITIGAQVTGGGIGPPPRAAGPLPVPAGFRLVATDDAQTFTTLRYRAGAPQLVNAASLGAVRLGGGSPLALLQPGVAAPGGRSRAGP